MDELDELFEDRMKLVLNLLRTNNIADDAMKITQAAYNLAQARNTFSVLTQEPKTPKKPGASAS